MAVPEEWRIQFDSGYNPRTDTTTSPSPPNGSVASVPPAPTAEPTPTTPVAPTESTSQPATTAAAPADPAPETKKPAGSEPVAEEEGEPIRGVGARIVANMEASLDVPTATSFREVPAKLLEVNRTVLNNHLRRTQGGKVSFTHLIGYAIVRAIAEAAPSLSNTYLEGKDGKPRIMKNDSVNLGLAVDMPKPDGSRTLLVVVIKEAQAMNFAEFLSAYEGLITKVRANKITVDDMMGANVTLTNPGTIGTVQSVPRLMPGQGAIIGVGRLGFPTGFAAADPKVLAQLGISKTIAVTSTYDHRIIQGAESGYFLKKVHELLLGEDSFYDEVFASMNVPYEAVEWNTDKGASDDENQGATKQMAVNTLINQYRVRGHLISNVNPLRESVTKTHPELDPATYGLTIWDLDREFITGSTEGIYASIGGEPKNMKLSQILGVLRDAYCRSHGVEYMHIADPEEKRWMQERLEGHAVEFETEERDHILDRLTAAEGLEKFLAARYVGQKRFGLEGAESAIPILDAVLSAAADDDMERAIIGMAHRGRLNVLVNIMGKDPEDLFGEFEGGVKEGAVQGSGDVKYHLGFDGEHTSGNGNKVAIELAANPSHLEAVDPVVLGMARAHMDGTTSGNYPILPVLIHGDAAFAGQGVVTESLNLSQVHGYKVGGTVHLIVNNQLGYTTAPHQSRSTDYSTDVAKMVQAPIFHVNADDPEACVHIAKIAFDYRQRFNKDVVIDMIGYRRHGHNEGDDPSYTQPMMYKKISNRPSALSMYVDSLLDSGAIDQAKADEVSSTYASQFQASLDAARDNKPDGNIRAEPAPPPKGVLPHIETGVGREDLDAVYAALTTRPEGFTVHPKLQKQFDARDKMWESGEVDWALGEAFAMGTILAEGRSLRLAGQDSRRGTFAHRHATLHDYETGEEYTPLKNAEKDEKTDLWIYDSTLSEYAALGFEYGYAISNPEAMVIWEAQFGDFVNGAQIIIDQFLVAAEDKWNDTTRLTMLLPHGYEGQGPEHSSGRLERFMLLCAEDNIQVANVTTAAQFFHLLRRQMVRSIRRPLVVFTPKSGLRAKTTRSRVEDLLSGSFEEVLAEPRELNDDEVTRIILASGKVATEALAYRDTHEKLNHAVVRVEQLYPWPFDGVQANIERYPNANEIVWLQEEPENMGAWNSVKGYLYERHGDSHTIRRTSRTESGSPATGSNGIHHQEQAELLERAFGGITN